MEWQGTDFDVGEGAQSAYTLTSQAKEKMQEEIDKQAYQLKKYQDPSKDIKRQEIIALTENFGTLLTNNNTQKIAIDLLTDDFEGFIFSSTGRTPVQHQTRPQGFMDLWKGTSIIQRLVISTDVDSDKSTAWQICEYKIIYEGNTSPSIEIACEIFTVNDNKISKYRAFFGAPAPNVNEFEKFLVLSRKDKMLAKIKEINYALAGKPDLEKVASLFNESTEYRIWRWSDHKRFTLYKADFCSGFVSIEERMFIKSIVPYDISIDTEQKFISGHYVYHLEERSSGNKFIWLTTCVYGFDPGVNLTKISQHGELYPEGEADITFELYSRDVLVKKATEFLQACDEEYSAFYNDITLYDCRYYTFMPESFPNPGYHQGLKHMDTVQFMVDNTKHYKVDSNSTVDAFVDHSHESYDVVLLIGCVEAQDTNKNTEEIYIGPSIFYFENGKIAKELDFISAVSSIIPSPFDDKVFKAKNIVA